MYMRELLERSARHPLLIGVVHLLATPGAPGYGGSTDALFDRARGEVRDLIQGGVDAVLVENFGDVPFFRDSVPAETIAAIAVALERAGDPCAKGDEAGRPVPLGVNVLRNDARAGLGLCAVTTASFFRVNVHTGAMVTDQGLITGDAAGTLRERTRLAPEAVLFADVHVKHATPLGREALVDAADEAWNRGGADALVISGTRTGAPPDESQLAEIRSRLPAAPLFVGSGLDLHNAPELLRHAQGAIVGTALKQDGCVAAPVDPERVARMAQLFRGCRGNS